MTSTTTTKPDRKPQRIRSCGGLFRLKRQYQVGDRVDVDGHLYQYNAQGGWDFVTLH